MVAESGADGHATELPAEELPQGGVFVRPRKTKIPVSELLTGIMVFCQTPFAEREGFEPPVQLPVHRISSAARSTTPASLPVHHQPFGR